MSKAVVVRCPEGMQRTILEQYVTVQRHRQKKTWWRGDAPGEMVIDLTIFDPSDYEEWDWLSRLVRGAPATSEEDVQLTFSMLEMVSYTTTEKFAWWERHKPSPFEEEHYIEHRLFYRVE